MIFAQPWLAAAALACAAIPFLLHLLLRRPRPTAWPSTMLLQRAVERLRRRRKLERWLLLLSRSMALLLAGLAMAGPLLRSGAWQARERWIVVDDAATAAERLPDGRPAIDWIRAQVRAAVLELHEGDRVAIVLASQPARVALPPTPDLQRALREVDALQVHAVPADWKDAIDRALPAVGERMDQVHELMLVGTFRRGSVDPDAPLPASWAERLTGVRRWCVTPPPGGLPNRALGIVGMARSVSDPSGSGQVPVRVQMVRTGKGSMVDPVTVRSPRGETVGGRDATWSADATETQVEVPVRPVDGDAMLVEASSDAQPLDDAVPIASLPARDPVVLVLGRRPQETELERLPAASWVMRALEAAGLRPQEVDPTTLALRPMRDVDAVVACRPDLLDGAGWQWLERLVQDGGTLLVMPVPEATSQAWAQELTRSIGQPVLRPGASQEGSFKLAARQPRSPLLSLLGAEVDALAEPVLVTQRWPLADGDDATPVIVFEDGTPAMTVTRPRDGRGVVVTLATATALECTDLPLKPMMVPLLQEIVRGGRWLASTGRQARSGEVAQLGSVAAGGLLQPTDVSQGAAIEVDAEGVTVQPVPSPGLWKLRMRDGRERWIAVRLDPSAARIEPTEPAVLEAWRSGLAPWQDPAAAGSDAGVETATTAPWVLWMFAALTVLLLLESVLARQGSPRATGMTEAAP